MSISFKNTLSGWYKKIKMVLNRMEYISCWSTMMMLIC